MIANKEIEVQLAFLETEKRALEHCLKLKEQEYNALRQKIRSRVYGSLHEAERCITNELRSLAKEDCEGELNCGSSEYSRDFIVAGVEYTATVNFYYDRYDKTHYYIDRWEYSCKEKA